MVVKNIISRRFIFAGAVFAFATIFVPSKVTLAQGGMQTLPSVDEGDYVDFVNVSASDFHPNLAPCLEKLRDPSSYIGRNDKGNQRKVLKQIELGKNGWLFSTSDFRTDFTMTDKTLDYMVAVKAALKSKGVDLYLVIQPPRAMLMHEHIDPEYMPEGYDAAVAKANYKSLIKKLNGAGIAAADLSDIPTDLAFFFKGDIHWRREGAQWSAEQISKLIRENEQYSSIKKEEFYIENIGTEKNKKGEFIEFVEELCDVVITPEPRPIWETTSKVAVSNNSLSANIAYADIAVVGTSNTEREDDFNFVGSLKQALSVDVRNNAMPIDRFSNSLYRFFSTDEFQNHPPKILIWEFISYHDFDEYKGFRQMIPAIKGGCSDGDALVISDSMNINDPKTYEHGIYEIIFMNNLENKHIRALDSYLELNVTEPEKRKLHVSVLYVSGDADTIDISRSSRVENNGRYFIDFTDEIDQELMVIQIETDKPLGKVKARLCSKNKNI